ncbi:MAG: peptidoglycan DD-metalloendopeptidase family protein [Peptoniphilus sp.]|nr:peptidoglycan DD-metalloendopeptidase family protein [Peptoniphilus sp.]MDY3118472.1 peptidoglycan DD-metalloendopeptidase family protein [Peptoniphilus sp.]
MDANHRKKISAALAVLMLSSQPVLAANLEAQRSEAVQKKSTIRSDMVGTQSRISQTKGQVASVEAEIRALDAQITQVNVKIDRLNGEMQKLQAEIAQTKAELEAAKAELLAKKDLYAKRLRAMYIANDRGYLDILLDSADAESLIGNARMVRSIAVSDRKLIDEITAKVKEIEEKQALLAEQEKQLAQKQEQARKERSNLEAANAQKTSFMNGLMSSLSAYEAQYDEMLRQSDAIESQIANLDISIQKAKEEEAARIAKEKAAAQEARRQKEAAVDRANKASKASGRSSVESGTRSASSSSSDTSQSYDVVQYGEQATPEAKTGELYWPVPGYHRITSPFGYRIHPILKYRKLHTGVDIGAPNGAPVVSAQSGTVIASRFMNGYGNCIMVDHGSKVTVYAHLSSRAVSPGQSVSAGQTIGYVGSTGMSTGPHLHFEVRVNGAVQNPLNYL